MKIIEPKVELLSEENISPESHIARCARVCYGREWKEPNQEADEKMVEGLIKRGHYSMLRHHSIYGCLDSYHEPSVYTDSPYCCDSLGNDGWLYLSTNGQFFKEAGDFFIEKYTPSYFLKKYAKDAKLFELFRLTFCITTQISTSRELNRVSPNNIAERSTRYCSSKDGLVICKPWWYDGNTLAHDMYKANMEYLDTAYKYLLLAGLEPENARGILPLDTATRVIYTYSIKEWQHILDLRLYDKTGKAHPNCKVVMVMVRDQINEFTKAHNIDYKI